jgi:hypothetical protein
MVDKRSISASSHRFRFREIRDIIFFAALGSVNNKNITSSFS